MPIVLTVLCQHALSAGSMSMLALTQVKKVLCRLTWQDWLLSIVLPLQRCHGLVRPMLAAPAVAYILPMVLKSKLLSYGKLYPARSSELVGASCGAPFRILTSCGHPLIIAQHQIFIVCTIITLKYTAPGYICGYLLLSRPQALGIDLVRNIVPRTAAPSLPPSYSQPIP